MNFNLLNYLFQIKQIKIEYFPLRFLIDLVYNLLFLKTKYTVLFVISGITFIYTDLSSKVMLGIIYILLIELIFNFSLDRYIFLLSYLIKKSIFIIC